VRGRAERVAQLEGDEARRVAQRSEERMLARAAKADGHRELELDASALLRLRKVKARELVHRRRRVLVDREDAHEVRFGARQIAFRAVTTERSALDLSAREVDQNAEIGVAGFLGGARELGDSSIEPIPLEPFGNREPREYAIDLRMRVDRRRGLVSLRRATGFCRSRRARAGRSAPGRRGRSAAPRDRAHHEQEEETHEARRCKHYSHPIIGVPSSSPFCARFDKRSLPYIGCDLHLPSSNIGSLRTPHLQCRKTR
jgi:hypothetical protein